MTNWQIDFSILKCKQKIPKKFYIQKKIKSLSSYIRSLVFHYLNWNQLKIFFSSEWNNRSNWGTLGSDRGSYETVRCSFEASGLTFLIYSKWCNPRMNMAKLTVRLAQCQRIDYDEKRSCKDDNVQKGAQKCLNLYT